MLEFFISSAYAQTASEPLSSIVPGRAMGELLFLFAAFIAFALLSKLYARWPTAEIRLVCISLAGFVPMAAVLMFVTANGRLGYRETLSWLVLMAPLLGGLWWIFRTKTTLISDRPLKALDGGAIDRREASPPPGENPPRPVADSSRQSPPVSSVPPTVKMQQPPRGRLEQHLRLLPPPGQCRCHRPHL